MLFRWTDDSQAAHEGAGFCRDISTEGVLVIAFGAVPPLGRPLELMVLLPPLDPKGPTMRLCATGSVVRMEAVGKATGLGIATVFCDCDNSDHRASSFPEEKVSLSCS